VPTSASATISTGHRITTRTGHRTVTRPASDSDLDAVNSFHSRCSMESCFSRYQAPRRSLSLSDWHSLVGSGRGLSWVTHPADTPHLLVAATHLMRTDQDHLGELGILIEDAWQNRGLGTELSRYAIAQASALGVRGITVITGRSNLRMLTICKKLDAHTPRSAGATITLTLPVNRP